MRVLTVWVLVFLALAAPAAAQVATPSLLPVSPGVVDPIFVNHPTYVPTNPAVLSWGKGWLVGGGVTRADLYQHVPEANVEVHYYFEGTQLGLRWTGEQFAAAVQHYELRADLFDVTLEDKGTDTAGAWKPLDSLSVGIGSYSWKDLRGGSSVSTERTALGATYRFGETIYVGVAGGSEDMKGESESDASGNWTGGRSVTVLGVGYLGPPGDWRFRGEISSLATTKMEASDGDTTNQRETQRLSVEGVHGIWRFGLEYVSNKETSEGASETNTWTSTGEELALGIGDPSGPILLIHYAIGHLAFDSTKGGNGSSFDGVARTLSLVWPF